MSRFLPLAGCARAVSILTFGLALTSACHQRSSVPGRPSTGENPDTVNIGYGQQSRERAGGAVQSVTADELANVKVKRVEELLAGRFPGVHVVPTPAGGFSIRIRGATAVGDREPLYVVDGMPVEVTPGRGLDWLNPADIARIDVLRDAAQTSMYGGRGANGVVLITTKQYNQRRS